MNQPSARDRTDPFRLDERTAMIAGGLGGLGSEIALALAAQGAILYIADLPSPHAAARAAELGATFVECDATSLESVQAAVAAVKAQAGAIDIAVNCVGINLRGPAEFTTDEDWQRLFDVNATGMFRLSREQGTVMLDQGHGSIVNIASIAASLVGRPQSVIAYASSKAAVLMMSKSIAVEWAARGVRVNTISPGYVETSLTADSRNDPTRLNHWLSIIPMGRIAQPNEVTGAVVFLASDASTYVTGHDLIIDGGLLAV